MTGIASAAGGNGSLNVDQAVRDRYSAAARKPEPALCCPVEYDPRLLVAIPDEIIRKDYGCGDPSRFVRPGETVLDLGSGGGKICYIAAQIVGADGSVIGVDCNDDMLALARKFRPEMAERLGFANVEFRKGRIQDLQLDLDLLGRYLHEQPAATSSDWLQAEEYACRLRETRPLIAEGSIDVLLSNCVLNLVRPADRRQLFREMHRVLKRGGRAVVSDIVSDEDVPPHLQADRKLWSGCLSGAHREDEFLAAFEDAGFYGVEILTRQSEPWAVVEGIEFRSVTVRAFKGKEGPCLERNQAVVYRGPWKTVIDDDGHKLIRGQRTAVCDKTFHIYGRAPYADQVDRIEPHESIPLDDAQPFDCRRTAVRSATEMKGSTAPLTLLPQEGCCGPDDCC
ncbi:MAG: methyltransferase domain-containing protein [Planctomycetaceae bacterium]